METAKGRGTGPVDADRPGDRPGARGPFWLAIVAAILIVCVIGASI